MFKYTPEQARKLWVETLRSGKYQQGIGALRQGDSFCCLGVACELFRQYEGWDRGIWIENPKDNYSRFDAMGSTNSAVLPEPVVEWLGLSKGNGPTSFHLTTPRVDFKDASLIQCNDYGLSFNEIADIIEGYIRVQ